MSNDETRIDLERVESRPEGKWRGRHVRPRRPFSWISLVVVGALLIIVGSATLLYKAYTEVYGHQEQTAANQTVLENQWDDPAIVTVPGAKPTSKPTKKPTTPGAPPPPALAKLTIPSLGKTWYIVNGITNEALRYAPGHYPSTAMPGKVGNFSVAGHREPGMFWDLDQVKVGQTITVETHTYRYTYTVRKNFIIPANSQDGWVVQPVPTGFSKGDKLITLTTCNPKTGNYQRLIVQGQLTGSVKL